MGSKLFFLDNGLRNVAIQNFDSLEYRVDKDHLIENMVFSNLRKNAPTLEEIHFWRTKAGNEVDFILEKNELIAVEVKYKPFPRQIIPPGVHSFIKQYPAKQIVILTQNYYGSTKIINETKD